MKTHAFKITKLQFSAQLSHLLLNLLLNLMKKGELFLKNTIQFSSKNIQFLRHFDYSKKNLTKHFMEKASAFFGIEWEEDRPVLSRKTILSKRKKGIKSTLNVLLFKFSKSKILPVQEKNQKKNTLNFYRAPE